ncbi:hypothetical protein ACNEV0_004528 [Escherichia coli]|uniref:Type VI secretion system protein n=4 Tax=Escherichia coli TaxID=562 RepID=A0AB38F1R0_ECOLX|nr:hypothetical protein [Escherichia coli]EFW0012410.1 hypothetical protein [Shigella sonnei]EHY1524425.1 hypothetical protein [Escherichia coli O157]EKF2609546.1 hypothetical protein [Escherichia coli O45]HDS1976611.1 hypothetical protein [Escherichia coli O145:NM str. 2012C-4480]HDS1981569.1 hypothetical protein [Escherichia coli O145:NM str. 2012C-4479]HDS1986373.1 hypothetical protein [Escherichia coli O145:NM str. 2012C-4478]HDS1995679.1 hypothetical protein [Escherichia coli O145:NM st
MSLGCGEWGLCLRTGRVGETRTQNQDTQALAKEINQRLDGLLSRWLLLKNTGQDMATDNSTVPVLPTH